MLSVFVQHFGDTHLTFLTERIHASIPAALAPWILTVLHHAHWGVDLFFVLSGFSLSQPLLARLERARLEPSALIDSAWRASFFRRRAARIYPAYLAALALVIVAVPAVRHHPAFGASLLAHLALIQGYYTPGGLAFIGAAWSLTTEASFYLLWPFLAPRVLGGPARPEAPRSPWRPWVIGALIVALAWMSRGAFHDLALRPGAPPWLLEASQRRWATSRLDQFVLGSMAAALHSRVNRDESAARKGHRWVALTLLCALSLPPIFFLEGSFYQEPLGSWPYALLSLATAGLVLSAALCRGRAADWLFPRPLRAVGVVSYGVFLHHQLALGATAHLSGPPGSWAAAGRHAALALGLSLLLGWASWVFVERPVIEWAAKRGKPRAPAP